MRNLVFFRWLAIVGAVLIGNIILGVALNAPTTTSGDGRSLRWDRFDVTLDEIDTSANRFQVTEDYTLTVTVGPFSYGFAEIPTDRLERITNFEVWQDGNKLRENCSGGTGTYCLSSDNDVYGVTYYFRNSVHSRETVHIQLIYTVEGALRSYSDGDQLYWVAVPGDRSFPVLASQVRVIMPSDVSIDRIGGNPSSWKHTVKGNTITWTAPGSLGTDGSFEMRVQYPHDSRMSEPDWQGTYDLVQTYKDNVQPVVSLLVSALSVLLAVSGSLWVIVRYQTRGRDPKTAVVPEYLTEPPSDELPGVVGLLLDEQADMRDIMGTLIDLARRGYLAIEQTETSGVMGLFGKNSEFKFHRTDKPGTDLTQYESILYRGIFKNNADVVALSALREKFYTSIPAIKNQMYAELVKRGYFTRSPEKTRQYWLGGSIGVLILASLLFWGAYMIRVISPLLVLLPIALGIVGAAGLLAGNYMPAKTDKGSLEAARWRAFRRYLSNIKRYTGVEQAATNFDRYIAYAVVFGLDQNMVKQLVPAMTAMPTWYHPTYIGGPWGRGYHRGESLPGGGIGGNLGGGLGDLSGPGGLNSMSESLSQGLNAMSSGMTRMLNDASHSMTSRPKSSGSGGRGGGWSGGGRGFGGGSGGGRRGFG